MNNIMLKLLLIPLVIAAIASSTAAIAGPSLQKDPFAPFSFQEEGEVISTAGAIKGSDPFANIDPVTSYSLKSYRVIGTMTTDDGDQDKDLVTVKARDRRDYYLTVGRSIGKEGGIVKEILHNGIKVDIDGREIFIIVRNRFEIEDDAS